MLVSGFAYAPAIHKLRNVAVGVVAAAAVGAVAPGICRKSVAAGNQRT